MAPATSTGIRAPSQRINFLKKLKESEAKRAQEEEKAKKILKAEKAAAKAASKEAKEAQKENKPTVDKTEKPKKKYVRKPKPIQTARMSTGGFTPRHLRMKTGTKIARVRAC